jgi:hypothetical protein
MVGGKFVKNWESSNQTPAIQRLLVANGVTITKGDFVYYASGFVTNAAIAAKKLIGLANSTVTGNGTTVTVEVITNRDAVYLIDNDNVGTTFAQSHVGTYFDLTGGTGAMQVDTSTTATTGAAAIGEMLCVEYNPQIAPFERTTSIGLFVIASPATVAVPTS